MRELACRFIGKECVIYTLKYSTAGIVKEVSEGAILVEHDGLQEAVNLALVAQICEKPQKKKPK